MAGRSSGPDLNLPSREGTDFRQILIAIVVLLFVLNSVFVLLGQLGGSIITSPLRTLLDLFVLLYASSWLATAGNGAISHYGGRIHEILRSPYTRLEYAILDRLGGDGVAVHEHPHHIKVGLGIIVVIAAIALATALSASIALVVLLIGGLIYGCLYILSVLSRGPLGALDGIAAFSALTSTPVPSAGAARDDPDQYDLPMSVQATDGDVSRYNGGVLVPRNKSVGMTGATRSGKTEVAKHFVAQMREQRRHDEPVIVYDHKRDFQDALAQWGVKTLRLSATGSSVTWNLFREVERERDLNELGRALFPSGDPSGMNQGEDGAVFFSTASQQIFVAVAKYLRRECKGKGKEPTNAMLLRYFMRTDVETLHDDLTEYEDFTGVATAVDPEASRQARAVYATVQQRVEKLFGDDFADAPSDRPAFSIRGYMKDPQGYVLVLDRPQRQSATVAPIFRFLIDRAAMHALEDGTRGSYFVLDEFARLPQLGRIEELVNVGAGQQTQVVLTLQAVSQLYQTYGRDRGRSILAGLATQVLLRAGDKETVEHYREAIGTHFEEYTGHTHHKDLGNWGEIETERETRLEEEHPFSKGDLQRLDVGECVIVQPGGWAFGYIPRLSDIQSST